VSEAETLGYLGTANEVIGVHPSTHSQHPTGADVDEFVFTMPEGGPLDYSLWRRRYWQAAVDEADLPALTFHDLRRSAATALVVEGVDMKTAQTRLGHADPRMTLALRAGVKRR
jgi:integrase